MLLNGSGIYMKFLLSQDVRLILLIMLNSFSNLILPLTHRWMLMLSSLRFYLLGLPLKTNCLSLLTEPTMLNLLYFWCAQRTGLSNSRLSSEQMLFTLSALTLLMPQLVSLQTPTSHLGYSLFPTLHSFTIPLSTLCWFSSLMFHSWDYLIQCLLQLRAWFMKLRIWCTETLKNHILDLMRTLVWILSVWHLFNLLWIFNLSFGAKLELSET